jgi:hypothetical protein
MTCKKKFEVEDVDDDLPDHTKRDGRRCPHQGPGLFVDRR